MPEVAFVMSARQHYPLRELAETLQYELELQAVPSSVHLGRFPEPQPSLVYVLMNPIGYVAAEGEHSLPAEGIVRRTIFVSAESISSAAADKYAELLRRPGAVFVLDQRSVVVLHRLGIPARLLRPGYSRSLDRFDPDAARPIDVMFLGTHSLRRTKYLGRAARVLSRRNCLLQVSEDAPSPGDTTSFLARGRWPLLAQTKILMCLHRGDESRIDWRGALDAIHAGAVVVTEHSSGIAPLVPGEHLLVASADSIPHVVDGLLGDEQHLARLRSQAYERLSRWIPYALSVAILRAAIVELVGEPLPPGAPASETPPEHTRAEASEPSSAEPDRGPRVESPAPGVRRIRVAHESSAWVARRAPRVTAITALRGNVEALTTTLGSLAHSRLRDFELVVVDGGMSESSRDAVDRWMLENPRIAARLVVSEDSRRGAARNIGLDFARGAFCLILDQETELYPRCLEVLTGTLESLPEMTFAYPMQEVTGAADAFVEAGGDYLLSFLGWDPGRLRTGSYIYPPVLIRTDRLRALGGFGADPRLEGFEDYDLWCRVADRGLRGQLVAQVLARRRESGSSDALTALHPSPGPPAAALTSRAPRLMSGAFATH